MANEMIKVLLNIIIVFGGATIISLVGVGILLFVDKIIERYKNERRKRNIKQ